MASTKKSPIWILGLLALATIGGCASLDQAEYEDETPSKAVVRPATSNAEFLIGPEDVLEIVVWKEDGLKKDVLVRPDGGISYPLVGEIQAAGKTPGQLQVEITKRLSKFIPRAAVTVSVLKTASYKIYLVGKVNKPGEYTMGRHVDVLQALSLAGGLNPFADADSIRIVRRTPAGEVVLRFNYDKAQRGIDLSQNVELRSGDTLIIP
jgi:polysaccharide biosynthesis/export protein